MLIYMNNFEISLYTTLSNSTIINSLKNQNENQNRSFPTKTNKKWIWTAHGNSEQMQNRYDSDYMNIAFL